MKRLLTIALVALVAVPVVLAAAGAVLLGTEWGRGRVVAMVNALLDDPAGGVRIAGLSGEMPFRPRLGRIEIADASGVWLALEGARIELDPGSLWRLEPRVTLVSAERVAMLHKPKGGGDEDGGSLDLAVIAALPRLTIERIELPQIDLAAAVATVPVTLAATGRIVTGGEGGRAEVELDVLRRHEASASVTLRAVLDPAADAATVNLLAVDPGGLLAGLLGRPEVGAARVELVGEGPLAGWTGRLDGDVAGLGKASLDLRADLRDPLHLAATGTLAPERAILPPVLAELLEGPVPVEVAATLARNGGWSLDGLRAGTTALSLEASASAAAGASPQATATLHADSVRLETVGLSGVDLQAQAVPSGEQSWSVTAKGTVASVTMPDIDLATAGAWQLDAAGTVAVDGPLALERFTLANALAEASGTGRFVPATGEIAANLAATVADLGRLQALATIPSAPTGGTAELTFSATRPSADQPLDLDARLTASGLAGLPQDLLQALGPEPRASIAAALQPSGALVVDAASLEAATGSLQAKGRIEPEERSVDLRWNLAVPDLATLSDLAGTPLAGALSAAGSVAGALEALRLTADASVPALTVGTRQLTDVALRIEDGQVGPAPAAKLSLAASQGGVPLALRLTATQQGDTLTFGDLALDGPGTSLAGTATVNLKNGLATGDLRAVAEDLGRLAAWHRQSLRGRTELGVVATTVEGRQDLALGLRARNLRQGDLAVATTTLRASLADALGTPRLDTDLRVDVLRSGEKRLDQVTASATGPLAAPAVRLAASGDVGGPAQLDLRGLAEIGAGAVGLRVDRLDATIRGIAIAQSGTARLRLAGGGWSAEGIDLRAGDGRLAGSLAAAPGGAARGELRLSDLPLSLLEALGAPALDGDVHGSLALSGAAAAPTARLQITGRDIIYTGRAGEGVPPADIAIDATLAGSRLEATGRLERISDTPMTASAALPVRVSLAPFAFALVPGGEMRARVVVDASLERITPRHLLDERRIAGRLQGELRLAGPLSAPRVAGSLAVSDGRYDDAVTGTTLRDLEVVLTGRDRELVLERLQATDGAAGRLDGSGRASIDPSWSVPWQAQVTATRLRAIRADLADATLSGRIDASGDLASANVRGALTIDDAEIRIPDRLAGSIPVIDVTDGTEPAAPPVERVTPIERSTLAVTVKAPGRIFVRGRGLDSEWKADLVIRGSLLRPRIEGPVTVVRGLFDVIGRRFELTRGEIRFQGTDPPDPVLTIRAEARAQEVTAIVVIGGRASRPDLNLTSEPALPQDEVLARLLFGRDANRISAAQAVQIAAALRDLAGDDGPGLLDALGTVRDRVGLDTLDFGTESGSAGVRAGKYLSDEVYLEVERGLEPGTGRATVEIELTPNIRVQSEVTDRATTGVGLEWRFDY